MKFIKPIMALGLLVLLAAAAIAQEHPPKAEGAAPKLFIESPTHDFGEVKEGTPLRFAFTVKNQGTADLLIQDVRPGCGCTKGSFDKVVPPGKEGKIELAVEHTKGYAGEVAKAATVTTNDAKYGSFTLTLRARFISEIGATPPISPALAAKNGPLKVEPTDRWDTSILVGNTTTSNLYVINRDAALINVKALDPGGPNFSATLTPIQEGRRYEIKVTTAPNLKPGTYHQTMKVVTDNAATPVIPVQLNLTVYPRIFAAPAAIVMPVLPIGTDLATITWPTITVRKVQATGLEIKRVSTSLAFLDLTTETQKAGEVYQIHIKINNAKAKAGEFKGTVRIDINDKDIPFLEVPVQVSFK